MKRGGRITLGGLLAVIGLIFLVTGLLTDDMWFLSRHPGSAGEMRGAHHWETDPVGYLFAAAIWGLVTTVGITLFVQGVRGVQTRR